MKFILNTATAGHFLAELTEAVMTALAEDREVVASIDIPSQLDYTDLDGKAQHAYGQHQVIGVSIERRIKQLTT